MDRRQLLVGAGSAMAGAALPELGARAGPLAPSLEAALTRVATGQRLAAAAVAIGRRGKLIGAWTFGHASLQFLVPVTDETLFEVASVAKHVTATGVLKLVDEGRVRLDEPVRAHLPMLPSDWGDRTVRHLLTHTSGLPDFTLAAKLAPDADDPTREQQIQRMQFRKPLFGAGEGWSYCNSNYLLLGWLLEDRTGTPFSEAIREGVLRPAGALRARADGPGVVTPKLAEPYVFDQKYWRVPFRQSDDADGSGSLQWSVSDIAPWGDALLGNRAASRASRHEAVEWQKLSSGLAVPYGFGLFLDRVAGNPVQWHNGGALGTVGMFLQIPSEELTIAVMSNTDTPGRTMRSMGWMAAHAVAPGATYLDLPALPPDGLDARLATLCATPGPLRPDPSLIAPGFLKVLQDPTEQRRFNPGFGHSTRLERIEEYRAGEGLMRRYRVIDGGSVDYKLAGFDQQNRLFWLWGC